MVWNQIHKGWKHLQRCPFQKWTLSIPWSNQLSKFSPSTAEPCEYLRQLTSIKTEWTMNATYQKLFHKAKLIIAEDACMKFYNETQALYLETDASGAALLQTRSGTNYPKDKAPDNSKVRPIMFANKSQSSAERRYSTIERKALPILHGFKEFHPLLLCMRWVYNILQTASSNLQEKCSNTISENTMNSPQSTPVQSHNHTQTWIRSINSRLALHTKLDGKKIKKDLACNWMLTPYRQLQTPQTALWYSNYNKQPDKMITYISSKNISSEAGKRTKIKYHKIWKHTGHFEMIWQWLIRLYSKADMY